MDHSLFFVIESYDTRLCEESNISNKKIASTETACEDTVPNKINIQSCIILNKSDSPPMTVCNNLGLNTDQETKLPEQFSIDSNNLQYSTNTFLATETETYYINNINNNHNLTWPEEDAYTVLTDRISPCEEANNSNLISNDAQLLPVVVFDPTLGKKLIIVRILILILFIYLLLGDLQLTNNSYTLVPSYDEKSELSDNKTDSGSEYIPESDYSLDSDIGKDHPIFRTI